MLKIEKPKPVIAIVEVSFLIALAFIWLLYAVLTFISILRKFGRKDSYLTN